ncbi:MAG: hypothetical protein ABI333_17125 [bacterium]
MRLDKKASIWIALWTLLGGPACSDSRVDPAGLHRALKQVQEADTEQPLDRRIRPRPSAAGLIPTPAYRLDVRVDTADLALLPSGAGLVAAVRPDLPVGLTGLVGAPWKLLAAHPSLGGFGPELLTGSLADSFGLRPDRAIVVAALFGDAGELLSARRQLARLTGIDSGPTLDAALKPDKIPRSSLRIRLVAQVAREAQLKQRVALLFRELTKQGARGHALLTATDRSPHHRRLAARGVFALGMADGGIAHAWILKGGRLLVELLIPTTGRWTPPQVSAELERNLNAKGSGLDVQAPFTRATLLSSADLSLLIDPTRLAEAAQWLGVRELLKALPVVAPEKRPRLYRLGWRVSGVPRRFVAAKKRAFSRFGLRIYLLRNKPQLRLSWRLTTHGEALFRGITAAVAGRDLAHGNGFIDRWLKPLAARVDKTLPPEPPFTEKLSTTPLAEGGLFMLPLALADFWPRLLPQKAVRKVVLSFARQKIRPGRFVRRVNVLQRDSLLELVLEGKPPSAEPTPPGPR